MENSTTTTTTTSSEELRSYCNINNMELGYLEEHDDDDDEVELPGFRFHPTDEELVSFYLRRKIENKPISIELIKQIDIYKYDPWDLPKSSSTGEKEGYFYCKRGRKYRNSIRPNRVTGSGFWKATGIDKPVYDNNNDSIIGLKKTLVYYRGSAGKGTKTEWMMHEFRHPPTTTATANNKTHINNNINIPQEAEIWTLCRIFKRNASHRKCAPADHWRHFGGNKRHSSQDQKSNNSTVTTVDQSSAITTDNDKPQTYINFGGTHSDNNNDTFFQQEHKPLINNNNNRINYYYNHHHQVRANDYQLGQNNNCVIPQLTSVPPPPPPSSISSSSSSSSALSFWNNIHNQVATNNNSSNDLFAFENSSWDELGSVVQFPL